MKLNRRKFLKYGSIGSLGLLPSISCNYFGEQERSIERDFFEIDKILSQPVMDLSVLKEPIIIASLELKRYKNNFIFII